MANKLQDFSFDRRATPDRQTVWGNVQYLSYGENVSHLLSQRDTSLIWLDPSNRSRELIDDRTGPHIVACSRQGQEYFHAARATTSITSPVLLYYGMLSLAKVLVSLSIPDFMMGPRNLRHGLTHIRASGSPVSNHRLEIKTHGVFSLLRKALRMESTPDNLQVSAQELFEHVPDIYEYVNAHNDCIFPAHVTRQGRYSAEERVSWLTVETPAPLDQQQEQRLPGGFERFPDGLRKQFSITEGNSAYRHLLDERNSYDHETFLQNKKFFTSFSGKKYLPLKCRSTAGPIEFTELEILYLCVFLLSSLARYEPQAWTELTSGFVFSEMYFVSEFLAIVQDKYPFLCSKTIAEMKAGFL